MSGAGSAGPDALDPTPGTPERLNQAIDPRAVPIRPAATVMLVRDSAAGPEVFLMRRNTRAAFASGMYVFPGGALDPADGDGLDGSSELDLYVVASLRECFEEAGVLVATDVAGALVSFHEPEVRDRFNGYRHRVHSGQLKFWDMCRSEGLRPDVSSLVWVSHWITPFGENRRFDTRFFVVPMPAGQDPLHDDHETVASEWLTPVEALARRRRGEMQFLRPTAESLKFIGGHSCVADVMAAARSLPQPVAILPQAVFEGGKLVRLILPDEPDYDIEAAHGR